MHDVTAAVSTAVNGGAISANGDTRLVIHNASFLRNKAMFKINSPKGGAIYASGGTLTITNAQFTSNSNHAHNVKPLGGGIYAISKASVKFLNVTFTANKPDGFNCYYQNMLSTTTTSATTPYTRICG